MATNIPNLDNMNIEELKDFGSNVLSHPVIMARELFPHRPKDYVKTTRKLGYFALNKALAMGCRARGESRYAPKYEEKCNRIYNSIPIYYRW